MAVRKSTDVQEILRLDAHELLQVLNGEKKRRNEDEEEIDWETNARPEQKAPEGSWFGWLIMAGRGFGKTRTGAETIKKMVLSGEYKRICLLGETYEQVRSIMVEGESGLLAVHSDKTRPVFKMKKRELIWPNGSIATCYSAEDYEALRGPQFDCAWIDELAKFDNAEKMWDQLMFCLRLGKAPRVIITTTPRPRKIMYDLLKRKDIHLTQGSTFDNAKNLAPDFLNMLKNQYVETKLGKQEIDGKLVSQDTNALWTWEDFEYTNLSEEEFKELEIIVAIDPATTSKETSNETGMIVAGKRGEEYFIIEDQSGIMKPEMWIQKAITLHEKYNAKEVIVETNQGGEILMAMLKSAANIQWISVRAKDSKYSRAESISGLYKQKKVKHLKKFEDLEDQLLKAHQSFADDRLDALTWALFTLVKRKSIPQSDRRSITCW